MKRRLKKRKGFVLSTCLAAMTLIMVLTSLIVFLLTIDNSELNRKSAALTAELTVEQIGYDFLSNHLDGSYGDYSYEISGDTLTVINKSGKAVLRVVKDGSTLVSWTKNPAEGE